MALIVACGLPCSGKTTMVRQLSDLLQPSWPILVIDEDRLHLERQQSYQGKFQDAEHSSVCCKQTRETSFLENGTEHVMHSPDAVAEKRTRGQLKAAVDRALAKNKVVILDSMNSIKGYRCAATVQIDRLILHMLL